MKDTLLSHEAMEEESNSAEQLFGWLCKSHDKANMANVLYLGDKIK